MKYILTISLFIAVGIQTFSKWMIVISYEINKNYIAANLCVNKTKPDNTCHGKCYLQKKLAADEDQQKPLGKTFNIKDVSLELFCEKYPGIIFENTCLTQLFTSFYKFRKSREFIQVFFQPPRYFA